MVSDVKLMMLCCVEDRIASLAVVSLTSQHMYKPRFLDWLAETLGDLDAFSPHGQKEPKPFQAPHVEPRWPRDRVADVKHIKLAVTLDFAAKEISGIAAHRLAPIVGGLRQIEFDQVDLDVKNVKVDGRPAVFDSVDGKLVVRFGRELEAGEEVEVSIAYRAQPQRGLYFVGPDEAYPNKPLQAWTQGEDEDSRYWFPCYDYPNDKATSEVLATVPANFFALSNGALVETREDRASGTKTYHWRHDIPHPAYLITLVAGEFVELKDSFDSLPVVYYVTPGREEDAWRAFGNTPRMIEFFSRKIGVRYPYAKYAQVAVVDFIFGGMENTSATTQTVDTLHDARAHLDFTSDPLIAHELAHQWWGDLVTCRDWSHAWLNEGFATYFEALWCEENLGADEFAWNLHQDRERYFEETRRRYRRPIVCNRYRAPIELFDRHLYEKGGLVLHMLRRMLGDELFFKALNLYCTRHYGCNVITQDLQEAIEEATGRNLDFFFDQWVYKEGHPELKVSASYDDKQKLATVIIEQTHVSSDPAAVFRFPVTIALIDETGQERRHRVEVNRAAQAVSFAVEQAPKAFCFDPECEILASVEHKRSRQELEIVLRHAPAAITRANAARELGKEGSPAAVMALSAALFNDRFWGVQAEAAKALGEIRTEAALSSLTRALSLPHPKARRAVCSALGAFRGRPAAADALIELLERGDQSYFVEAEAALALGKTRDGRAFEVLTRVLERDSYLEVIRVHALGGLAELREERAIGLAKNYCTYGQPPRARVAAVGALAKLGSESETRRSEILDFLTAMADDREFMVRMRLPAALEELGDSRAISTLERMSERALDGRIRRRAEEAIAALKRGRSRTEEARLLRDDLEQIREENRKLRERIERLEALSKRDSDT
jgi:aminopeptidase N